ncbi:hypothetical protein K1719_029336 [Acacia pycnantha]|nr:hypothetical protein K1719_029336 [Acacia pycnantha]
MQHDLLRDLVVHLNLSNKKPLEQRENLIIDINKTTILNCGQNQRSIASFLAYLTAHSVSISSGEAFTLKRWSMKPARAEVLVLNIEALPVRFCDITSLEKVSITDCHNFSGLPHDLGNLENLQVLRLNSCTYLVDIPVSVKKIRRLSLLDMSYSINLFRLPEEVGKLSNLLKLYMAGCSRLSELPTSVTKLVKLWKVI